MNKNTVVQRKILLEEKDYGFIGSEEEKGKNIETAYSSFEDFCAEFREYFEMQLHENMCSNMPINTRSKFNISLTINIDQEQRAIEGDVHQEVESIDFDLGGASGSTDTDLDDETKH